MHKNNTYNFLHNYKCMKMNKWNIQLHKKNRNIQTCNKYIIDKNNNNFYFLHVYVYLYKISVIYLF